MLQVHPRCVQTVIDQQTTDGDNGDILNLSGDEAVAFPDPSLTRNETPHRRKTITHPQVLGCSMMAVYRLVVGPHR